MTVVVVITVVVVVHLDEALLLLVVVSVHVSTGVVLVDDLARPGTARQANAPRTNVSIFMAQVAVEYSSSK